MLTNQLTTFIQAKVSMQRLNAFLTETELLDGLKDNAPPPPTPDESDKIFFHNASFAWTAADSGPSRFKLHIDDLEIPRGKTTLVSGKTSAGKSSLLLALLGEMNWIPEGPDSSFNLPRSAGVAYAAQEAWVMADTVRNNITLDNPWDAERYQKVIHQCALERDLELFAAGDQTELGEKGLNAR
jgi:ABC-type multidrug transport system fused ATPase/permease subunit